MLSNNFANKIQKSFKIKENENIFQSKFILDVKVIGLESCIFETKGDKKK